MLLDAIRSAIERSRTALRLDAEMRAVRDCYRQVMRKMHADSLPDLVTMGARLGLRPAPKH